MGSAHYADPFHLHPDHEEHQPEHFGFRDDVVGIRRFAVTEFITLLQWVLTVWTPWLEACENGGSKSTGRVLKLELTFGFPQGMRYCRIPFHPHPDHEEYQPEHFGFRDDEQGNRRAFCRYGHFANLGDFITLYA